MDYDPGIPLDSLASFLDGKTEEDFRNVGDKARYLLASMRYRYEYNLPPVSDSVLVRYEYYFEEDAGAVARAYFEFYSGYGYYVSENYSKASECLSKAMMYAGQIQDRMLCAQVSSVMGYLYRRQGEYWQALKLFRQSYAILDSIGSTASSLIPLYNEASSLNETGRYHEASDVVAMAMEKAVAAGDSLMVIHLCGLEAAIRINDTSGTEPVSEIRDRLFDVYERYCGGAIPDNHLVTVGQIYLCEKDYGNARIFLSKALDYTNLNQKVEIHRSLSVLEEEAGDLKAALSHERQADRLRELLYEQNRNSDLEAAERKYRSEYLQMSYDLLQEKHRYQLMASVAIVVLLVVSALSAVLILRRRLKVQKARVQQAMDYVENVRSGFDEINGRYIALSKQLEEQSGSGQELVRMLHKRMDSLKELLEMASRYESRPALFYDRFKSIVKVDSKTNIKWEQDIITLTDLSTDNFISRLSSEHPELTLHERCYCSLMCLGFSQESIRVLYGHTNMNSIYSIRTKIRSKLGLTNSSVSLDNWFRSQLQSKMV